MRSTTATSIPAPSKPSAMARPRPLAAPVMMTVFLVAMVLPPRSVVASRPIIAEVVPPEEDRAEDPEEDRATGADQGFPAVAAAGAALPWAAGVVAGSANDIGAPACGAGGPVADWTGTPVAGSVAVGIVAVAAAEITGRRGHGGRDGRRCLQAGWKSLATGPSR